MPPTPTTFAGDRLAKVIARAGLCSRRDAEDWIRAGRVNVNGKTIRTPAFNVTGNDAVVVDGRPLGAREGTRVWLYHKPAGLVVTEKDPEGRPTVFDAVATEGLPRVVSIGRLDINTEGLLLLTNDGGLKRVLELPATGWLRRYRVRAFGTVSQQQLEQLAAGLEIAGVKYGPIEATLEREQGSNVWLLLALREGKNREVKNVLGALGLQVNRLIRVSFGPFQLGDLPVGAVDVVKARVLREQLGKRLADEAGVDFDSDLPEPAAVRLARRTANPGLRAAAPGKPEPRQRRTAPARRFADDGPTGRASRAPDRDIRPPRGAEREARPEKPRRVFNPDGTTAEFVAKTYGKRPKPDAPAGRGDKGRGQDAGDRPKRAYRPRDDGGDRPKRNFDDRPKPEFGERPKPDFGVRRSTAAPSRRGTSEGGPKRDFADRPKRPFKPRAEGAADRPKRPFKPRAEDAADRPERRYAPRSAGGATDRPKRTFAGKPGGRPSTDKPFAKRPRGSGPQGDRPRRPRPPRA
jgi:23S rRNA pseudouridine2605 synthase